MYNLALIFISNTAVNAGPGALWLGIREERPSRLVVRLAYTTIFHEKSHPGGVSSRPGVMLPLVFLSLSTLDCGFGLLFDADGGELERQETRENETHPGLCFSFPPSVDSCSLLLTPVLYDILNRTNSTCAEFFTLPGCTSASSPPIISPLVLVSPSCDERFRGGEFPYHLPSLSRVSIIKPSRVNEQREHDG